MGKKYKRQRNQKEETQNTVSVSVTSVSEYYDLEKRTEYKDPMKEYMALMQQQSEAPLYASIEGVNDEGDRKVPDVNYVRKVLQHAYEGNWDTDSLAAELLDVEMTWLNVFQRIKLISCIADGTRVGTEDEETILRLLKNTKQKDHAELLTNLKSAALLKDLESVFHGDEYIEYHNIVRSLKFSSTSEKEAAKLITDFKDKENPAKSKTLEEFGKEKVFFWASPGVARGIEFHAHKIDYENVQITKSGMISFDLYYDSAMAYTFYGHFELDPMEIVSVKFITGTESMNSSDGQTIYMPALNLMALANEEFNRDLQETVDVALIFAGGVGLAAKATKLQKMIAAADLAFGIVQIGIEGYRVKIKQSPEGKEFLKYWDIANALITIYGFARTLIALPQMFKQLKDAYRKFKPNAGKNLNSEETKNLDDKMNEFSEALEDIEKKDQVSNKKGVDNEKKNLDIENVEKKLEPEIETKYEDFGSNKSITWKVKYNGQVYENRAVMYGGIVAFDFNTLGAKGLGKKFLKETFEKYGSSINEVQVSWNKNEKYPGGKAKGLKDFWDYMDSHPSAKYDDAFKNSGLYQLVKEYGFINIAPGPIVTRDVIEFYIIK